MATYDYSHLYSFGKGTQNRGSWHRIMMKLPVGAKNGDKIIIGEAKRGMVYLGIQGFYAPDSVKLTSGTKLDIGLFEDPVDSARALEGRKGKTMGNPTVLGSITAGAAGAFTLNTPNYDQPLECTYRYGFGVDHKIALTLSGLAAATTELATGICLELWVYVMFIGEGAGGDGNGGGDAVVKAGVAPMSMTELNTADVYKDYVSTSVI